MHDELAALCGALGNPGSTRGAARGPAGGLRDKPSSRARPVGALRGRLCRLRQRILAAALRCATQLDGGHDHGLGPALGGSRGARPSPDDDPVSCERSARVLPVRRSGRLGATGLGSGHTHAADLQRRDRRRRPGLGGCPALARRRRGRPARRTARPRHPAAAGGVRPALRRGARAALGGSRLGSGDVARAASENGPHTGVPARAHRGRRDPALPPGGAPAVRLPRGLPNLPETAATAQPGGGVAACRLAHTPLGHRRPAVRAARAPACLCAAPAGHRVLDEGDRRLPRPSRPRVDLARLRQVADLDLEGLA